MIHAIKGPAANTFAEHVTMFCGHVAWRGYGLPEADLRSLQGNHDDCKRCLASLAKRDREFQQKSRAGMTHLNYIGWAARQPGVTGEAARKRNMLRNSVRAIAREEGRAL